MSVMAAQYFRAPLSILNTRFNLCAPVIAERRSAGVGGSSHPVALLPSRNDFRRIFTDGNTYDDDAEKIDYDEETIGVTAGLAYSWKDLSLTFAINDLNVNESDDGAEEYSEYGTITVASKLDRS